MENRYTAVVTLAAAVEESQCIAMTSQRLSFIAPSTTSSTGHPSPLSPLSSTSLDFLSSSSSVSLKGQRKRTRKSLAEEQELYRIMDPIYLGSSNSASSPSSPHSRWSTNLMNGDYYADPEGYWHDIDHRPFPRITGRSRSCFSPPSPPSSSSSSSSCSLDDETLDHPHFNSYPNTKTGTRTLVSKRQPPRDRIAYWETFTVSPYTTIPSHLDEEPSGYSIGKNPSFSHSPSRSSHSYLDLTEPTGIEIEDRERVKHRVLMKKKAEMGNFDTDSLYSSKDNSVFLSAAEPSSSLPSSSLSDVSTIKGKGKHNPQSSLTSKKERFHRTLVTTTFIARLKVIRTKRWLRERVFLST